MFQSHNICQLASAAENKITPLPLDDSSGGGMGKLMMMRAMTVKDFDPVRYSGRWFEVASLKGGFAGQGQGDCHCTQVNCEGYVGRHPIIVKNHPSTNCFLWKF